MTAQSQQKRKVDAADRRLVARLLLIELLAIETQRVIFGRKDGVHRLVEFGPAKVLGGIAKRSVEARFAARDMVRAIERQYLSCIYDSKRLYFEYDPPPTARITEADAKIQQSRTTQAPTVHALSTTVPASTPLTQAIVTASIADVPISAKEIVRSLVANKVKKKSKDIQLGNSIKDLAGGKSTLQNELLGDLGNEFGAMPDGSEDMPIESLGEALEPAFSGQLGRQSSSIVAKLISSKMPAGFNLGAIRDYLKSSWGLGPGREAAVMLFAITAEPSTRLSSVAIAKEYFDSLTKQYAEAAGIVLQAKSPSGDDQTAAAVVVDSAQLDTFRKEQRDFTFRQIKLLKDHVGIHSDAGQKLDELAATQTILQNRLDLWGTEFSDDFEAGIKSSFDVSKARRFNFSWNSVREGIIRLFSNVDTALTLLEGNQAEELTLHIANRADRTVLVLLAEQIAAATDLDSRDMDQLDHKGASFIGIQRAKRYKSLSEKLYQYVSAVIHQAPVFKHLSPPLGPVTDILPSGVIEYHEAPRDRRESPVAYPELVRSGRSSTNLTQRSPYVHLKSRQGALWEFDDTKTKVLHDVLRLGADKGISYAGKDILITGAGPGSIGAELVRGLLRGGARIVLVTSRPPSSTASFYREMFDMYGARGSELLVIPCNQASKQDCEALINYIYGQTGLNRNLDAIVPFAAISESGAEIDDLGAQSELAHRMMLVNVLRLLGSIVKHKHQQQLDTRPTQVLIPLSPNHGNFGGDGLYSESKLGLESLLNKFHSESWSDYLLICGAIIGWTRGTGLMEGNNIVAQEIESHHVVTFSQKEMAFNLLALMSPSVVRLCENEPVLADLNGGLQYLPNLRDLMVAARSKINLTAEIRKAITTEDALEASIVQGPSAIIPDFDRSSSGTTLRVGYPTPPDYEKVLRPLDHLQGMVDLSSVIVIVGFSELGPWGSSRTRWEMEHQGQFSREGYIEMAWMMNLIKHFEGNLKGGEHYVGWVDTKTGQPVRNDEVGRKYGQSIHEHSGIRPVEPGLFGGYDPQKKEYLHEIAIEEDLPEFETTRTIAEAFRLRHGINVEIRSIPGLDHVKVRVKRGAHVSVPKAVPFEGEVAGQLPTGWDPLRYGITEDLSHQVDPVTLYTLCCVSEALYSAGIENSLEIFKYIHLSELGNFIGSSFGGMKKIRQMYRDRYLDKEVQGDIIQEGFANTPAAWVNMLLLGAAGPIKTPVGVCATGVESMDSASESILCGKTKICLVGGTDDFQEEASYGFGSMKATVNSTDEASKGRNPREMSRPTAETRAGFVESQGAGVQIIATAKLALEMGLPIYGVVASSAMAADKITRSLPAPGQGILSFCRSTPTAASSPLLSLDFRREQMRECITRTRQGFDVYTPKWCSSGTLTPYSCDSDSPRRFSRMSPVSSMASMDICQATARRLWGNEFRRQDMNISPLEAALAVWGLTVNDIDIISMHGTSTKANDKNESEVIHKQMTHLGRTHGRPVLAICQKSVTGHPKAPAATWMLNGCLQAMNTGIVPGNRNADNVDETLQRFDHIAYPTRPIYRREINAFLVTSFGFGQKGGQMVGIAPKYLFATLEKAEYHNYLTKFSTRTRSANRAHTKAMLSSSIFRAKTLPPYQAQDESKILMDPMARVSEDWAHNLHFDSANLHPVMQSEDRLSDMSSPSPVKSSTPDLCSTPLPKDTDLFEAASKAWVEQVTGSSETTQSSVTVGIDVEQLSQFGSDNQTFIDRNYTEAEQTLASRSADPHSAFAGRWSAKEAVFKSLGVASKGAGAPLKEIEILSDGGIPRVKLHGDALNAAREGKIHDIKVSLSHSDNTVMAVALALRDEGKMMYA
ncbi:MAG: hypothetical protein Q9167_002024 [Letrouitia subvulpina]